LTCQNQENNQIAENSTPIAKSWPEVMVASVAVGPIYKTYTSVGTVMPQDSSRIFPKVAGRIFDVLVEEGDQVKKGDLLMQINTFDYARAFENATAVMNQAKSNLTKANRDFARMEKLFKDKAVSKQNYQDMKTASDLARFAYDQAVTALKKAKDDLKECGVRAPISGMITNKLVNPGELTGPQVLAFVIMQMGMIEVEVDLPEEVFGYLKTGNKSFVTFDAIPDTMVEGTITKVYPTIDPISRTVKMTITIDNPDLKIRSGMTARTKIVQKAKENALYAPKSAMIPEEGQYIAYKLNSGKVAKITLDIGIIGDDVFEIKKGVTSGERLVVRGITGLRNGMKVKVVSPNPKE